MRVLPHLRAWTGIAAFAIAALSPGAARAGGGAPGLEDEDDDAPALGPPAEDAPRGVQDGVIAAAVAGAADGLVAASAVTRPPRVAARYAALDRASCEAELGKRHIAFERVAEARGVLAPVRLHGPVGGVDYHSMLPPSQRRSAVIEIVDCRLVLALDDFARILAKYDVVEVVHYSFYRPPRGRRPLAGPAKRHPGGLAIDAARFVTKDGRTLDVLKDFKGRIGAKTCGTNAAAPSAKTENAATLRRIVCEAAEAQLFNVLLTPDYNWQHRNHFHLEVTAGARWQFVR